MVTRWQRGNGFLFGKLAIFCEYTISTRSYQRIKRGVDILGNPPDFLARSVAYSMIQRIKIASIDHRKERRRIFLLERYIL